MVLLLRSRWNFLISPISHDLGTTIAFYAGFSFKQFSHAGRFVLIKLPVFMYPVFTNNPRKLILSFFLCGFSGFSGFSTIAGRLLPDAGNSLAFFALGLIF